MLKPFFIGSLAFFIGINTAKAATPLWSFTIAEDSSAMQFMSQDETIEVRYLVQNHSNQSKNLLIDKTPAVTQVAPCLLSPHGQCLLRLSINGSLLPQEGIRGGPNLCTADDAGNPNPNQCYQPPIGHTLNINLGTNGPSPTPPPVPPAPVPITATISVSPNPLYMVRAQNTIFTISNSPSSSAAAENVMLHLPNTSIVVDADNSTCGASLAIGDSCTLAIYANSNQGPFNITASGLNTNTVPVVIQVVNNPTVAITGPTAGSRLIPVAGGSLNLQVTNQGLIVARNVSASGCTDLTVDSQDCVALQGGASCNIVLSSNTAQPPCTLTVFGDNLFGSNPTTKIAFSYLGGIIINGNGSAGKILGDVSQEIASSMWTSTNADIVTGTDGFVNTANIIASPSCSNDPANCAAQKCYNMSPVGTWYLPSANDFSDMTNAFCVLNTCIFGSFSGSTPFWTSSQSSINFALVRIPPTTVGSSVKNFNNRVRCVRNY